jgi:hypothetical protein
MTKQKLKISNFKNMKIENFQNSHEERHIPYFLAYENFTQKNEKPQNDKKKIEDFKTPKQKTFEVSRRKPNTLSCPM